MEGDPFCWELAYLHAQVLPAVDPRLEHRRVRGEPGLQPAQEGGHVRPLNNGKWLGQGEGDLKE